MAQSLQNAILSDILTQPQETPGTESLLSLPNEHSAATSFESAEVTLVAESALVLLAAGLGLRSLLLRLLDLYSCNKFLVILLDTSAASLHNLKRDLLLERKDVSCIHVINNETSAKDRLVRYLGGGVLSVTSRIFVVDLLNKLFPVNIITGIIVNHAHRVTENSTEAFILRLFRDENKVQ
ncbi:DNA repair endonuclease XPF, partial [Nowakowskiella sp. JEL0078]